MALVTFAQAKEHLRLPDDAEYKDVERKLEAATAVVLMHIQRTTDHGWTSETDPASDLEFAIVQAAILEVCADLFRNRGDEPEDERALDEVNAGAFLKRHVRRMLLPLRSPSLA